MFFSNSMNLSEKEVREALMDVYDPEIGIDIVSMGLIYKIEVTSENDVKIAMTFTFPGCPYGPSLIEEVEDRVREIASVRNVAINLIFDPPWTPDSMDPDVKAALNFK
jgi:metal-sulfur cluster biosynthetic enzyme